VKVGKKTAAQAGLPAFLILAAAAAWCAEPPLDRLQAQLQSLASAHRGVVGVTVIHLESGRRVSVRGSEPFPMASTFKVPVAMEILGRVDRGELSLSQLVSLKPGDLHPGSGTLSDLFTNPGVQLSVRNLMELMLRISDNSAADILLRLAGGGDTVTANLHRLGVDGIQVNRSTANLIADWDGVILPPEEEWTPEKFNYAFDTTTAREQRLRTLNLRKDLRDTSTPDGMAALLERIWRRDALQPDSAALLLDIMARCDTGANRLKGMLPAGTIVAHKTGTLGTANNVTDDVGIVTLPRTEGHLAIAAFVKWSQETADERARVIAEMARTAYDYFQFQPQEPAPSLDYGMWAEKILGALQLAPEERVRMWADPESYPKLTEELKRRIPRAVMLTRESVKPGELAAMLAATDVFIRLPLAEEWRAPDPAEEAALARWLDEKGSHRQVHFHWQQGSVLADGLTTAHPQGFDSIYQDALTADSAALSKEQDSAIAALRSGEVRVRTPAGTDLRFRVGERPFNKQDGDASARRMRTAKVRVDREIELPCGALRVAPLETTVEGTLVVPLARFGEQQVRNLRLTIAQGVVTKVEADENLSAAEAAFRAAGEPAKHFREFALGFNRKLKAPAGSVILPYFAYGAGMVRLSLGDNEEIGGTVRGGWHRWFFFPDATVEAGSRTLVKSGVMQ
jgi:beta-lactamase class A